MRTTSIRPRIARYTCLKVPALFGVPDPVGPSQALMARAARPVGSPA